MNWRINYEEVAVAICNRLCGFSMAAFAVTALFAAQPAAADIIEINNFWESGAATFNFSGMDWHNGSNVKLGETGGADNIHSFGFAVDSNDIEQPAKVISSMEAVDLGRIYTNHPADIDLTYSSALAQMRLKELGIPSASNYAANIWTEQSVITRGHAQGAVVVAPVPKPQTYAMMLVGLGLLGVSVRRKN
jgi:hypothetical protein